MQITDEMVDRALAVFQTMMESTKPCERCKATGYHHGFGEHGHDPDWCEVCGGTGFVAAYEEKEAMRHAIETAVSHR